MQLGTTHIADTFAEAFDMRYARLVVTAADEHWLRAAVLASTGYACSIIGCEVEAGVDRWIDSADTPDGRPGVALLFFSASLKRLEHTVVNRAGQALMTCPTTAVFDGLPDAAERFALGGQLRYFGDGFQKSKLLLARRYWRIPVMDGEFLVEHEAGANKGVAGGNLIIQGTNEPDALAAARRAAEAVDQMPGVIAPFPGGIARSGSKVGSRYKKLSASTADAYCPTLRGRTSSSLQTGATCAYELVVDGVDSRAVAGAMRAALHAAVGRGIVAISAGNYGGKLGRHHIHLRELLRSAGD